MHLFLLDLWYSILGRFYLWIRYRDKEKIEKVLRLEYEYLYSNAGRVIAFKAIAAFFILLLTAFLLTVIFAIIKDVVDPFE
jgi:hypothetical protein